jgi:hypothetical protein
VKAIQFLRVFVLAAQVPPFEETPCFSSFGKYRLNNYSGFYARAAPSREGIESFFSLTPGPSPFSAMIGVRSRRALDLAGQRDHGKDE